MKFWFEICIIWYFDIDICLIDCRRILDLLEENLAMKRNLRVPAISRLQKIHNMDVVFTILKDIGIDMEKDGTFSFLCLVDFHSNFAIMKMSLTLLYMLLFQRKK